MRPFTHQGRNLYDRPYNYPYPYNVDNSRVDNSREVNILIKNRFKYIESSIPQDQLLRLNQIILEFIIDVKQIDNIINTISYNNLKEYFLLIIIYNKLKDTIIYNTKLLQDLRDLRDNNNYYLEYLKDWFHLDNVSQTDYLNYLKTLELYSKFLVEYTNNYSEGGSSNKSNSKTINMKEIMELCKANKIKLSRIIDGKRVVYKKKELITKLKRMKIKIPKSLH
jgi:hypothetical protein